MAKFSSFPSDRQFEYEPTSEGKKPSKGKSAQHIQLYFAINGYFWTVMGVLVATATLRVLSKFLDTGDESLLFLPVVIGSALRFGFGPACLGAFFSFFCWDYFFDVPYFALTISNAHDLISLVIYLIVAVTVALLASRAKGRAREAEARERETATLYQASNALSCETDTDRLLHRLAEQIVSLCRSSLCIVFLATDSEELFEMAVHPMNFSTRELNPQIRDLALISIHDDKIVRLKVKGGSTDLFVPLDVQGETVGTLYVGASLDAKERTSQEERMVMTLANHAALVIARQNAEQVSRNQAGHTAVLDERNRLARDVHDTLSHAFTGIKFLLEAADRIDSPDQSKHCIAQARDLAIEGAQEARRSVLALRPTAMDNAGTFVEAIKSLGDRCMQEGQVQIETHISGIEQCMPPIVEDNLLRIAQESVTNALKHSRSTKITIILRFTPQSVELIVEDDGTGFAVQRLDKGFGLISMHERAALIQGELTIVSAFGSGTSVNVKIPIQRGQRN